MEVSNSIYSHNKNPNFFKDNQKLFGQSLIFWVESIPNG